MKLEEQTRICKVCFKEIKKQSIRTFLSQNACICDDCIKKLQFEIMRFSHHKCECMSLYKYDDYLKEFIYQLKGCYDIELGEVFLNPIIKELRLYYRDYIIVPIPSNKEDDEVREFNHVEEIFSSLKLPYIRILYKDIIYKQSDQKKCNRKQIEKVLKMSCLDSLKNKNVLIVDDIFTTGSTLGAAIELIKSLQPKIIKCLVIARVEH